MLAATVNEHLFWITSRAAGVAGAARSRAPPWCARPADGRPVGASGRGPDLRVTARGAVARDDRRARSSTRVSLLGDGFLHPSLADITIPFVSSDYQRVWTTVGIVGGWMLIDPRPLLLRARAHRRGSAGGALHRFTALAWILGVAHALGEGTDAGRLWFLVATGIVVLPAAALLRHPHVRPRARAPGAVAPQAVAR